MIEVHSFSISSDWEHPVQTVFGVSQKHVVELRNAIIVTILSESRLEA